MASPLLVALVLVASYLLTRATLGYSERLRLIDVPNERSSHSTPTARGGGVAIVFSSLLAAGIAMQSGQLDLSLACAILIAGGLVALIGLWDDRYSLAPGIRLVGHVLAACLLLFFIGLPQELDLGFLRVGPSYLVAALAMVALVWLINLANFMDGIDGLAGAECVFVMAARGVILYCFSDHGVMYFGFVIAAAALGFLLLNWSPARIFMGDAGSGYIGLLYGAMMLSDTVGNSAHLWVWLILLSAFLADSTVTLLVRLKAKHPAWRAHRTHAYQHSALRWGHARTTGAFIAVNVVWLGPLAACASVWTHLGAPIFVLAVSPLVLLAWRLGAGTDKADEKELIGKPQDSYVLCR